VASKRHRAVVVQSQQAIQSRLGFLGSNCDHFTHDHGKAILLIMTLNAWAPRVTSYGLVPVEAKNGTTTYEIHEFRTRKGRTYPTGYLVSVDQTAANFQRLYGENNEGIPSYV
jgi:hypothetical protein